MGKKSKMSKTERKAAKKLDKQNRKKLEAGTVSVHVGDFEAKVSKDLAQDVQRFVVQAMDPPKPIKRPEIPTAAQIKEIVKRAEIVVKDLAKLDDLLDKIYTLQDERVSKEDEKFLAETGTAIYNTIDRIVGNVHNAASNY